MYFIAKTKLFIFCLLLFPSLGKATLHPCHELLTISTSKKHTPPIKFGIIGTSINQGQPHPRVSLAYDHLEQQGFWKDFHGPHEIFGSLTFEKSLSMYETLYQQTLELIERDLRPALIGGDHSQSFATISAILTKYPDVKVIWIDAHADIHTPETSPSGNIHGQPVAALMGLADKSLWNMPWLNQNLKPKNLVYLGIRDLDRGEIEAIHRHNIQNYSFEEIRSKGLENVLKEVSKQWKDNKVHVSFDIDSLDSSLAPATGTPVERAGFTVTQIFKIINWIKKEFEMVSFEVTEFNPELAKTDQELQITESSTKQIIQKFLAPQQ